MLAKQAAKPPLTNGCRAIAILSDMIVVQVQVNYKHLKRQQVKMGGGMNEEMREDTQQEREFGETSYTHREEQRERERNKL